MKNEDKFIFFYGGPFSQWYNHKFELNGTTYNTAEQYMMAMKATLFGDFDTYCKIMKTKDPKEQKALGRQVKNFNADEWNQVAKKYVYEANLMKFSGSLKQILLDTGDKEIVEASPFDCIWGIGLGEDSPYRFDKSKWRGTNWLGEVLMQVRKDLGGK